MGFVFLISRTSSVRKLDWTTANGFLPMHHFYHLTSSRQIIVLNPKGDCERPRSESLCGVENNPKITNSVQSQDVLKKLISLESDSKVPFVLMTLWVARWAWAAWRTDHMLCVVLNVQSADGGQRGPELTDGQRATVIQESHGWTGRPAHLLLLLIVTGQTLRQAAPVPVSGTELQSPQARHSARPCQWHSHGHVAGQALRQAATVSVYGYSHHTPRP